MTVERCVGLTILPEYIQAEGIDGILNSLKRAGATAVSTSPYVMEPATAETGSREPPGDAEKGAVRLLDRPLWGQDALHVRTEPVGNMICHSMPDYATSPIPLAT